ncbi:P-loop NTPase [Qipengyuania sp. YIM B01966]|uniref:P-loop NTPase n=1 Tax=Qipengyuania sp. YIM B01966 TaxID=2778646 RepID=UPI0018F47B05|nr:P-loop NTPase [Qipengyuania sp. YIM B01966]
MDEAALKALLPGAIAARASSARLADGRAIVVIDATGLDPAAREAMEQAARAALEAHPAIAEARIAMLAAKTARRIIAVGSGKGGVGKSTLTVNLAVALARAGHKVGVVDADIHGPSVPTLLASAGERPIARDDKLMPVIGAAGIPALSMGHLAEAGQAIAWRGPMAAGALGQLIDAHWGDVELLLVDLPPGTGDIQLTMLQKYKPAGAVIVSSPQDLALIDARRAAALFELGKVPLLGLVENMAGYACPHCGEISDPFGAGGVEAAAAEMGVPFLGRVPLAMAIRTGGDAGTPSAATDSAEGQAFAAIAARVAARLTEIG